MTAVEGSGLSILIPAFEEVRSIATVVSDLHDRYPAAELIVCDDGSTDGTADALDGLPVRVLRHRRNRGYGASWKSLAGAASGDLLVFIDGDGQFDPDDVARLIAEHRHTGADMVSGKRDGGKGRPLARRPGKWVMHRFAAWLTGTRVPDVNCGLRLVERRDFLRYLTLLPDGFSASTTSLLAYLASGREVAFVSIDVRRRSGTSSVRMVRDGLRSLLLITRLTTLFSPMRVFLPVSAFLLLTGSIYSVWEAVRSGLGVPVLGATLVINGLIVFLFGILADQVSALRLERLALRGADLTASERAD
jgi:glycosyltransferase involved in cell wall biosynthesis